MNRNEFVEVLRNRIKRDSRVVGFVDYGSGGQGRLDEWSDLDAALVISDDDYDSFIQSWKSWASSLSNLLLAYEGRFGTWAIYEASPLPLRVDFDFVRRSNLEVLRTWPMTPQRVDAMVLHDATDGALPGLISQLVGKTDHPDNLSKTLEMLSGDFWYFVLFCLSKRGRGDQWVARLVFHSQVLNNLVLLLRLEAERTDRWEGSHAASGLETLLSENRLGQLEKCIPGPGAESLLAALDAATELGREVIDGLTRKHDLLVRPELAVEVQKPSVLFAEVPSHE